MAKEALRGYASAVSPRVARDVAAISVTIDPHGAGQPVIGSGEAGEGGGPLRGALTLMNRFKALIADPEVEYEICVTVAARDGWLAVESITVAELPDGPAVNGATLRLLALSLYMQRIREELERWPGLLMKETRRTEHAVTWQLAASPDEWKSFDMAQLRKAARAATVTTEIAAEAYREALGSPDPAQNKRPTAAAAEKLGVSRGHVSRLLTQARREGLPGLGASRPPRKKPAGEGESR